jgi:DNA repair photolyase
VSELPFKRLLTPAQTDERFFFRSQDTLNLYRGCNHGCIYCDTRSLCYHIDDFDTVRLKADCLSVLERELRARKRAGIVSMGAASDAYNAREQQLMVTRRALLLLRKYGFGVFLSTKSALVARDADVLADMAKNAFVCVAFSVTTADEGLAALLESGAALPRERFAAMRALAQAGVVTGTWLNPMLPFLTDNEPCVRDVLLKTAEAGGRFALCHYGVTLREGDREYFYRALDANPRFAGVKAKYAEAFGLSYMCASPRAAALEAFLTAECARLGLACDFAEVNRMAGAGEPKQTRLW